MADTEPGKKLITLFEDKDLIAGALKKNLKAQEDFKKNKSDKRKELAKIKDKKSKKAKDLQAEIDAMSEDILLQLRSDERLIKEELKLKNLDIKHIGETLKELNDLELKAKERELKDAKIKIINEFLKNPELLKKPGDAFPVGTDEALVYSAHKKEIEDEVKRLLENEWKIKKTELTPEMVSDFVLAETTNPEMDAMSKRYKDLYNDELKKQADAYKKSLVTKRIEKKSTDKEDAFIDENNDLRNAYELAVDGEKTGELADLDKVIEREAAGKTLNTKDKALIAKYPDIYAEKSKSHIDSQKAIALELTKKRLDYIPLTDKAEIALEAKYHDESMTKIADAIADDERIKKEKKDRAITNRAEIADIMHKGAEAGEVEKDLKPEHKLFLAEDGEAEKVGEMLKKMTEDEIKSREAAEDARIKSEKDAAEAPAKTERAAFAKLNPEQRQEKRAMALARYEKIIAKKKKEIETAYGADTAGAAAEIEKMKEAGLAKRSSGNAIETVIVRDADGNEIRRYDQVGSGTEERTGSHERKMSVYNKNSAGLREILNNKEYQKLSKMKAEDMDYDQKKALEVFKADEAKFHANLKKNGPAGEDYSSLEKARAELAQKSQDFKHSYKSKFFGSKFLAGVGNMFGFKWSGIKEGKDTPATKNAMHDAQGKYDAIKQKLMGGILGEEQSVRKAWQENPEAMAAGMEGLIRNVKREFVNKEYEKLDALKHVLEGSVKKQAFEKFAVWYKNKYWNSIKDERVRNVVKRITNAIFLGAALLPFSAAAAGAVIGSRAIRAAIGGTVGESAAMAVAGIFGGEKNKKGEFERFAKMKEADWNKSEDEVTEIIQENIRLGKEPISQAESNKMKTDHEGAMLKMQRRENRVRKGEMWARLLAGGGSIYALSQLDPGNVLIPERAPAPTPIPAPPDDTVPGPSPTPSPDHVDPPVRVPDTVKTPDVPGPVTDDAPAPDTSLDDEDFGNTEVPVEEKPEVAELTPYEDELIPNGTDDLDTDPSFEEVKEAYKTKIAGITKQIKLYEQVEAPGTEAAYYDRLGYGWKGQMGNTPVKGLGDVVTEVYEKQGSVHYYAPGHENLADQPGVWKPLVESPMYKTFHTMQDQYVNAQNQIELLQDKKIALSIKYEDYLQQEANDTLDKMEQASDNSHGPNASDNDIADGSIETDIDLEKDIDIKTERWVDEAFGEDGMVTRAWRKIKDDTADDFLLQNNTAEDNKWTWEQVMDMDPNDFKDELTRDDTYSLSKKDRFLVTLQEKAYEFSVVPKKGETVENFMDRLAKLDITIPHSSSSAR